MKYLYSILFLLLTGGQLYGQLFGTGSQLANSELRQAINQLKRLPSHEVAPVDLIVLDTLLRSAQTPYRSELFLLAGWLERTDALLAVPYEYRRETNAQNNYDLALLRVGNPGRVRRLELLLASASVDDQFVFQLLPKLLYTRRKEVINFLFDEILQDKTNCTVADPHTSGNINCAYRLLEAVAPIVIDFPLQVTVSGDLDITDYPAALALARDWIRTHKSSYQINTSSF